MKFIEFDVDFEECGEVEEVILHDMYGRHESIVLKRGAEYRKPTTLSQLEAENAKLRAASDTWAENDARLRELVRDLITELAPPALTVDEINCGTIYRARIGHFKARARELGMEVDG